MLITGKLRGKPTISSSSLLAFGDTSLSPRSFCRRVFFIAGVSGTSCCCLFESDVALDRGWCLAGVWEGFDGLATSLDSLLVLFSLLIRELTDVFDEGLGSVLPF